MKGTLIPTAIVALAMLVLPLCSLSHNKTETLSIASVKNDVIKQPEDDTSYQSFRLLIDGAVTEIAAREYIFGVVAAEMPAVYEKEALKAQAVAAYTFACYRKASRTDGEYDLSADPETDQSYITREEAAARWGDGTNEYTQKLEECINEVLGKRVTYKGHTALTVYHAISSGTTNCAKDVWGKDVPYLTQVDSIGDKLANGYLSEVSFSAEDIAEKLKDIATVGGDPSSYFSNLEISPSGRVNSLSFCGSTTTGSAVAKALGLRSSNFDVEYIDGSFNFTVKGYGHGVGLSQNGANYMAKQGSNYEEILLHYYSNCEISK